MAYDDEYRPRRRSSDGAAGSPPDGRGSGQPPARRETIMQRRLRRARGEDVDDDLEHDLDDDYDDYPPRGYARPREAYMPRYSGGGCAATGLYIVLGGLVVLALFLLVGRQMFDSIGQGVPAQVQQIIATPTPTVRDRGGTILQIRNLSRLETQRFSVERVIDARVERGNFLDTLLGDRLLLIASGSVVAGVDLGKVREGDITMADDGSQITLRLPPSEVFIKALDGERTRVYDRQTGIFAQQQRDLETQARQAAEDEILKAACEGGIMQKAADEAQRSVERFLSLLDFKSVTVISSAGACVAPAATLPVQGPGATPVATTLP